jgi:hypothetical protein
LEEQKNANRNESSSQSVKIVPLFTENPTISPFIRLLDIHRNTQGSHSFLMEMRLKTEIFENHPVFDGNEWDLANARKERAIR